MGWVVWMAIKQLLKQGQGNASKGALMFGLEWAATSSSRGAGELRSWLGASEVGHRAGQSGAFAASAGEKHKGHQSTLPAGNGPRTACHPKGRPAPTTRCCCAALRCAAPCRRAMRKMTSPQMMGTRQRLGKLLLAAVVAAVGAGVRGRRRAGRRAQTQPRAARRRVAARATWGSTT